MDALVSLAWAWCSSATHVLFKLVLSTAILYAAVSFLNEIKGKVALPFAKWVYASACSVATRAWTTVYLFAKVAKTFASSVSTSAGDAISFAVATLWTEAYYVVAKVSGALFSSASAAWASTWTPTLWVINRVRAGLGMLHKSMYHALFDCAVLVVPTILVALLATTLKPRIDNADAQPQVCQIIICDALTIHC